MLIASGVWRASIAAVIAGASALAVRADVTYKEVISIGGAPTKGGGLAVYVVRVSGDKQRTDPDEAVARELPDNMVPASSAAPEIVRADRKLVYELRAGARTYTEETFEERRARLDRGTRSKADDGVLRVIDAKIEPSTAQDTINGFPCEQVVVIVNGIIESEKTDLQQPVTLTGDVWTTRSFPGRSEVEGFRRKYAEGLGIDPALVQPGGIVDQRTRPLLEEFYKTLSQAGGFPVSLTISMTSMVPKLGAGASAQAGPEAVEGQPAAESGQATVISPDAGMTRVKTGLMTRSDLARSDRVTPSARRGEVIFSMHITEAREETLASSVFEPPGDFRKLVPKSRKETPKTREEAKPPAPATPAEGSSS